VTANINASKAYLYGYNFNVWVDLTDALSISSTINYTYGRIKTDSTDYPLDHIPPVFGKTSLRLNVKKIKCEFFASYNGWKRLKDYNKVGEDNLHYATAEGMPSWYTLNLRLAYFLNSRFQIQGSIENIMDQNYRVFASGISASGRNLSLTLRGSFW
jgi:hemoglobin/transferrin/lactoferrin receptor protein